MQAHYQDQISEIQQDLIKKCLSNFKKKELIGYDGAEKVYLWFAENTEHPHPRFTFEREAMNRDMSKDNANNFALKLANELASLVAEREHIKK